MWLRHLESKLNFKSDKTVAVRQILLCALEDASRPYLAKTMAQSPQEQHAALTAQVNAYREFLADFCLNGYGGAGELTTDFVRALHRALFPSGSKQEVSSADGVQRWMIPGEYKSMNNGREHVLQHGHTTVFMPPDQVSQAMEVIVAAVNTSLLGATHRQQKVEAIVWFLIDLLSIHPFMDANGRVACILADFLAIRAGLQPFHFHSIQGADKVALYDAIAQAQIHQNLAPAREMMMRYLAL